MCPKALTKWKQDAEAFKHGAHGVTRPT
jgi:hypothetical protein